MNPILRWHWIKSKTPLLLKSSKAAMFNLWEKDYNSKIPLKPTVGMSLPSAKKRSTFNSFLQVDKDFFLFNAMAPIDCYHNYCSNCLTSFLECPDIVLWWDICGIHDDPVSLMAWDMISS